MNNEVIEIKIGEHTDILKEHEGRIGNLEKSDVKQESKIDNLCDKLDGLISSNNKIFYALLSGMAGILVKLVFF